MSDSPRIKLDTQVSFQPFPPKPDMSLDFERRGGGELGLYQYGGSCYYSWELTEAEC